MIFPKSNNQEVAELSVRWEGCVWPPDAQRAERPKNEADESSLWTNENRELMYWSWVLSSSGKVRSPHLSSPRVETTLFYPYLEMDLQARKGIHGWSGKPRSQILGGPGTRVSWEIDNIKGIFAPEEDVMEISRLARSLCTHSRVHGGEGEGWR